MLTLGSFVLGEVVSLNTGGVLVGVVTSLVGGADVTVAFGVGDSRAGTWVTTSCTLVDVTVAICSALVTVGGTSVGVGGTNVGVRVGRTTLPLVGVGVDTTAVGNGVGGHLPTQVLSANICMYVNIDRTSTTTIELLALTIERPPFR